MLPIQYTIVQIQYMDFEICTVCTNRFSELQYYSVCHRFHSPCTACIVSYQCEIFSSISLGAVPLIKYWKIFHFASSLYRYSTVTGEEDGVTAHSTLCGVRGLDLLSVTNVKKNVTEEEERREGGDHLGLGF